MIGSRPLTDAEVVAVSDFLRPRDRAIFLLGIRTGFRISEILSLRRSDVQRLNGDIVTRVSVERKNMKGKISGRTVVLHESARLTLGIWCLNPSCPQDGPLFPITRIQAWRVLTAAYDKAGLQGKLGTHCLRKTFANKVYTSLGHDLPKTQKALGHSNINSTVSYLSFADSDVDNAILGVS